MPAPGHSLSFSSLPFVTLLVALGASCQALLFSIHPSLHRYPGEACINQGGPATALVFPSICYYADVAYSAVASILIQWNFTANQ